MTTELLPLVTIRQITHTAQRGRMVQLTTQMVGMQLVQQQQPIGVLVLDLVGHLHDTSTASMFLTILVHLEILGQGQHTITFNHI
jgi:hypothetical protein